MEKSKDLIFKAAPFGAASFYLFSNKCVLTESAYGANPVIGNILSLSGFTCLQQSAMNFGILMIQGLVNSFGSATMAAFAVAVKIDTIAYMPVQDFGNAFSVFTAQNYGAGKYERIRKGIKQSLISVVLFCFAVSTAVFFLSQPLMSLFCSDSETIAIGVRYLRTEGLCYVGIEILFMLYGYYRAVNKPLMSVILTILSLGTRVLLAYILRERCRYRK